MSDKIFLLCVSDENPKNLPVLKFKNGRPSNGQDLLANENFLDVPGYGSSFQRRTRTVWLPEKDARSINVSDQFWGEVEIIEEHYSYSSVICGRIEPIHNVSKIVKKRNWWEYRV